MRFGAFRRVDVEGDADDQHRPARQVPFDGAAAILHPAVFAGCRLEAVFEFHRIAHALRVFAQLPVDVLAVVGMQVAEPGFGAASHCARE